jgi:hypothetical protein
MRKQNNDGKGVLFVKDSTQRRFGIARGAPADEKKFGFLYRKKLTA